MTSAAALTIAERLAKYLEPITDDPDCIAHTVPGMLTEDDCVKIISDEFVKAMLQYWEIHKEVVEKLRVENELMKAGLRKIAEATSEFLEIL